MKYLSLLAICWIFVCTETNAQTNKGVISGKVLSKEGKPIEGVNVVLKPSDAGQATDGNGKYSITVREGSYKIVISNLGNDKIERTVQIKAGETVSQEDIVLGESPAILKDLVVTGQFEAQSLKNSVYQVRTIDSERIRLRGATNVQTILNTELGMRFTNDPATGASDIELMGMTGQNVKILLDGIPMVDRGGTRESLGQIDINTIERIEIVEGPMSVIYGTDALAGVINIISKKGIHQDNLMITARIQEETVGKEYNAFTKNGTHNQHIGAIWQRKGFQLSGNFTRNDFGGWQGDSTGRSKSWMPKSQALYTASAGYNADKWNVWYRFNGTDETISFLGPVNENLNLAGDTDYISKRWFHQAQGEFKANEKLSFNAAVSYTDYSRKTLNTQIDFETGKRTLAIGASQDKSIFTTAFFRGTSLYKFSPNFTLLAGIDVTNNNSSGDRILGSPTINEYALFLAPEIKITQKIKLSPGLRFLQNSVYDAPPVIPSLNGKIVLNKKLDFRFGYARGFRSPALRELYFKFKDASHDIIGNENLKAEYSNSFNSSFVLQLAEKTDLRLSSTLGAFYNVFHDQITTGTVAGNASVSTYFNLNLFKTKGLTLENKLYWKNITATLGGSYIARYNRLSESPQELGDTPQFTWSPEINTNLLYSFPKLGATVNLFYKYNGKRPSYQTITLPSKEVVARLAETEGYHMADLTLTKTISKYINVIGGARNLFNVTSILSTSQGTGAHDPGNSIPTSYGRSYFLGLTVNWSKN
ncbi:TonB-dependent receptor [Dyadobacter sp. CY312]|uniref:TonB-dependent receptor n=1 Tax=Dyadobacter sp. CY312 TaxID=2907303 RepID=UPI001F204638|nr:TonB-dependent receptor [Dyadobacter sp. CY312]MCE7043514.1 TonB-dependent receptor [Dyadobacter sp. CY312]